MNAIKQKLDKNQKLFKPINPQKYNGDPTKIVTRSSWEVKFARWCDRNSSIVGWTYENTVVPYVCPVDGRRHRYFIDFTINVKDASGAIKRYLVEVKPHRETRPPRRGKNERRFLTESMTYKRNQAKWEAAKLFAKKTGCEFIVITEKTLYPKPDRRDKK